MKSPESASSKAFPAIDGYCIVEQLYLGSRTAVYRSLQTSTQRPVVIKFLRHNYPSFGELTQFRNQYTIAKNLPIPGIVRPLSLESVGSGYALIMEDCGGVALGKYQEQHSLVLTEVLSIGIQVADILHDLAQHRVVHKDIKPANILIHPDSKQVKLIDFSIASLLPKETQEIQSPNILEGTLAYLAPEQTGRMNRGIDYRADFYALGVTLYQLLTGHLPFTSADPLELMHCHIAKMPVPANQINPDVPEMVAAIVTKLMAKNAEDRYQSAMGLRHDLEQCLFQLKETGEIVAFDLGARDLSDRFLIPEKLYGRESEVQTLLEAFDRVSEGSSELMLVAGFSGIGKTAVVNEVHKPITRQQGYFIKGKFDQFNRNIPLSAFVQALRDLMGQLLSESDAQLTQWQVKILAALGENGQVLIDVIPELEQVIGKQPIASELSGSAAQNRFNLLFQQFIEVFTTAEHPLVLFLDDLQWADLASLQLIKLLMNDNGYLLMLGAYRDNEVSPAHPFILMIEEIKKAQAIINIITLVPLAFDDTNHLVADTLNCSLELAQPLTELIDRKTKGNPFFTTQFLKALYEEKRIVFNQALRYWECDIVQVNALALTDDVVEFMMLQLQKLPAETQQVLKLAACVGNQFDLATLAIVSEKSPTDTAAVLWKALQEGLILPTSQSYKFFQDVEPTDAQNSVNPVYRFLHDRVQQAAYSLIAEEKIKTIHLSIGQLLLIQTTPEQLDEKIFAIVSQLNLGVSSDLSKDLCDQIAHLNLQAARKARLSSAYAASAQYCEIALQQATDVWSCQPSFAYDLFIESANAACLTGKFKEVDDRVEVILQHTTCPLKQANAIEVKVQSLIARSQLSEAIQVAQRILYQWEVDLPECPTQDMLAPALESIHQQISMVESVADLPPMEDQQKLAAMKVLSTMASAAYIGLPALYPLIVLKQIELSLQFGNAIETPYAYSTYGLILCAFGGKIVAGNQIADIAIALMESLQTTRFKAKILNLVYPFTRIWQESLQNALGPLREGYQAGLASGDLEFAAYCAYNRCKLSYASGNELVQLNHEMQGYSEAIAQLNQTTALNFHQITHQVVLNWLGEAEQPDLLVGQIYDETTRLAQHQAAGDQYSVGTVYAHKLILAYHFGQPQAAFEIAEVAEMAISSIIGTAFYGVFYFYHALTLLATEHSMSEAMQTKLLNDLERLTDWSTHAPMNFAHKFDLVQAEHNRVLGHKSEAIDLYDRAISGAKENGYIQEEALANELAAKFYLGWGKEKIAQEYLTNAYYGYAHWGAKAKVLDLEQRYPQLLAPILQQQQQLSLSATETVFATTTFTSFQAQGTQSSTSGSTSISATLDLSTVLKASQTLASEIQLDKLLATLLHTVIENAGADKGALLMPREHQWFVEAVAIVDQPAQVQSIALSDSPELPHGLIHIVKRRMQSLVIVDAVSHPTLAMDAYVAQHQPKSLLCTPILSQGKLVAILYLENRVTVGAFTDDRVELLNVLCAQAAISLENARLYQQAQIYTQQLEQSQLQTVQSEKMASLGNLVAGVAHEINNPIGFLNGSIKNAKEYSKDLLEHLKLYQQHYPNPIAPIQDHAEDIDLEYLSEDFPKLLNSMNGATDRIKGISTSLRTFSRADTDSTVKANLHEGIDSTILILKYRLKANESRPAIQIVQNYGDLPEIQCFPGQLNQVFMNILANAIDVFDEIAQTQSFKEIEATPQTITITTAIVEQQVEIRIADNGKGMPEAVKQKIFDHLYTTKSVGKGTGLGLAIARQIVVEKHGGILKVQSALGQGTEFHIGLSIGEQV